jgi:hypothetical protein
VVDEHDQGASGLVTVVVRNELLGLLVTSRLTTALAVVATARRLAMVADNAIVTATSNVPGLPYATSAKSGDNHRRHRATGNQRYRC